MYEVHQLALTLSQTPLLLSALRVHFDHWLPPISDRQAAPPQPPRQRQHDDAAQARKVQA